VVCFDDGFTSNSLLFPIFKKSYLHEPLVVWIKEKNETLAVPILPKISVMEMHRDKWHISCLIYAYLCHYILLLWCFVSSSSFFFSSQRCLYRDDVARRFSWSPSNQHPRENKPESNISTSQYYLNYRKLFPAFFSFLYPAFLSLKKKITQRRMGASFFIIPTNAGRSKRNDNLRRCG
jgi:hypothetical protein